MKPLIIHHAHCADGFTAAWVVHHFLQGEAELHAASYYEPPPNVTGRDVFVVDFHYDRETTIAMKHNASSMVVLDHHRTAADALDGIEGCFLDMERSGAMMAWDYFGERSNSSKKSWHVYVALVSRFGTKIAEDLYEKPWLVRYVQDRDLWRWELPHSRAINAYIQHQPHTIENWDRIASLSVEEAAAAGQASLTAIHSYVESTLMSTQMMFVSGHLVPVVNAPPWHASELLNTLCRTPLQKGSVAGPWAPQVKTPPPLRDDDTAPSYLRGYWPPFAVSWCMRDDGRVGHSLRSKRQAGHLKSFDVSALAKAWGGGGHREAAGFVLDRPIFEAER